MSPPEEEESTSLGLWDGEAAQPQVELGGNGLGLELFGTRITEMPRGLTLGKWLQTCSNAH